MKILSKFALDFIKPNETDSLAPRATIYVKQGTKDDRHSNRIFITPQDCVDMKELNCHINRLIKELEDIRKKAEQEFSVAKREFEAQHPRK